MVDDPKGANWPQIKVGEALQKLRFIRRPTQLGSDYYKITDEVVDFITSAKGKLLVVQGDGSCYIE